MPYLKHAELANEYHVSLKTVYNWVDAAKAGKLDLQLFTNGGNSYIEDTPDNAKTLRKLAEKGKKFRPAAYTKTLRPDPKFYDIYNQRQVLDIITNLSVHGEIPRQYNYLGDGAKNWEKRIQQYEARGAANSLTGTIEVLRSHQDDIDQLLAGKKRVNVIDLGVGNARPVKELLAHLLERGVLHRYIGIDISSTMLTMAKRNIKEWFGDAIKFEGYERDFTKQQFDDLLVRDMLDKDADETVNLVLLLGDTPVNFRAYNDAFKPIFNSMHRDDLLINTLKPDTEASRRYFDFGSGLSLGKLSQNHKYILDLLNIDESLYKVEMGFNERERMRYIRVRLKAALLLQFDLGDSMQRDVSLEKGETILLFRAWHLSAPDVISELQGAGFQFLQANLSKDRQYLISLSGVDNRTDPARA